MFTNKNSCPVPFDQQPFNEYLALKKSWLFSWSISSKKSFILGLLLLFLFLFILLCIIFSLFSMVNNFAHFFLLNLCISNLVVLFVFLRLYLGWSYIVKRLLSSTVFYEESGWYDGQVWIKTSDYLIQDRLIGIYQVMPFIIRIKYTSFSILFNFVIIYLFNLFFE